jgi:hypothetical protein
MVHVETHTQPHLPSNKLKSKKILSKYTSFLSPSPDSQLLGQIIKQKEASQSFSSPDFPTISLPMLNALPLQG